jgi:hypothetical protein
VIPDFGDYSTMIMVLRPSLFHAQLQVCPTAQPNSGEKMQVNFFFSSPYGRSLDMEVTCLFAQVMLLWAPYHKHMQRSGDASTPIFRGVRKIGQSDY